MSGERAYEQTYTSRKSDDVDHASRADGHTAETAGRSFEVMGSDYYTPPKVPHYKFTSEK